MPLTTSCISAKSVLQGLEDSQLIRLFLDFVAAHRLNYHKQRKEISYKCFEATWSLPSTKATGYGRTETEAYKNALKNLLEQLLEDPMHVQYFASALPPISTKAQMKTQGHDPENRHSDSYSCNNWKGNVAQKKTIMGQSGGQEVEEAKRKIKMLEKQLGSILDENRVLKERIENEERKPQKVLNSQPSQKSLGSSKIPVPKLNLTVLPNYHKKSEKCLNDSLLAAYTQKHGSQKLY